MESSTKLARAMVTMYGMSDKVMLDPSIPFWSGACFSKVPKLFRRISGDIILFVSSKRRRLEAQNFAVIFVFIPFTTYEKTSFTA